MITPAGGDKDEVRLADRVRALDPTVRALLDLTLRRGFSDGEIGDLLGVPPDQATRMREQALDRLAEGSEGGREQVEADLKAFGDEVWILDGSGEPAGTSEARGTEVEAPTEEGSETAGADREPADTIGGEPDPDPEPERDAEPEPEVVELQEPEPEDEDEDSDEPEPAVVEPEKPVEEEEHAGPEAAAQGPEEGEGDEESEDRRGRIPPVWLAPLIALIALALVIWVIAMGNDDSTAPQPTPPAPTAPTNTAPTDTTPVAPPPRKPKPVPPPAKPAAPKPQGTSAAPLPGRHTAGKVSVSRKGDAILVRLRGLADPHGGAYAVWLFNSLIESRRIGAATKGDATINAPLPPHARSFRFLDISRERSQKDSTHSGESLFRVPLAPLLG